MSDSLDFARSLLREMDRDLAEQAALVLNGVPTEHYQIALERRRTMLRAREMVTKRLGPGAVEPS